MTKRARGEGCLYLRGGIWWLSFYDGRKRIRESSGTDDEKKARKFLHTKTGGVLNDIHADSRSVRYEDVRDALLRHYALVKTKSLRHNRDGSAYLESVRRMDGFFENARVTDIDTELMEEFQEAMQKQGYANGSINRSIASLRKMFTLAQRHKKIRNLPFFPMLPESKPRKGTLPREKYDVLRESLPEYLRTVVTIAYRTGMRRAEILGLTWANINWMGRVIRVEDSKNNEAREIPFSGELETILRKQFANRQQSCSSVCYRVDARGHARPLQDFRKVWQATCVKLGIATMEPVVDAEGQPVYEKPRYAHSKPKQKLLYCGLLLHDLRRTFVTDAENAGAPRHEVMALTGHKTESVYKRYAIDNQKQKRVALNEIDAYREKFGHNSDTELSLVGHDVAVSS